MIPFCRKCSVAAMPDSNDYNKRGMEMSKSILKVMLLTTALGWSLPAMAEVKIGLVGGITGATAGLAPEMYKAYNLAVAQVNEQGGILDGQKFEGVVADDGCNAQTGVDAVTKAVNVSQVIALAGPGARAWCSPCPMLLPYLLA